MKKPQNSIMTTETKPKPESLRRVTDGVYETRDNLFQVHRRRDSLTAGRTFWSVRRLYHDRVAGGEVVIKRTFATLSDVRDAMPSIRKDYL